MAVRVEYNNNTIQAKIEGVWKGNLAAVSHQVLDDCNIYCKERSGDLIASSYLASEFDEGRLIWNTKYAARQYWGIQTALHDKNPNAVWKWCEAAKARCLLAWRDIAQRGFG